MITVAIIGLGGRGGLAYADFQMQNSDLMKIVAIADLKESLVEKYKNKFSVKAENCFSSGEELLKKERLADAAIIASMDKDHYGHVMAAIDKGYDILLEKPISPSLEECLAIQRKAKEKGVHIRICHVLRYTTYFRQLKQLLQSGIIGSIRGVEHTENVAYWHYAHSFVRGNWKNSKESSPLILQKCCHDTDILTWLIGEKPKRVVSLGGLKWFTSENAPKNAPERCDRTCERYDTCPYNAEKFYLDGYENSDEERRQNFWMYQALCRGTTSLDKLKNALKTTDFGRCVFKCNNDVADHQIVAIEYENGAVATLTVSAFTDQCYRNSKFFGTLGEIEAEDESGIIRIKVFGKEEQVIDTTKLTDDLSGHNGGDNALMKSFLAYLEDKKNNRITQPYEENVIVSHVLCFAAERSRINNGIPVEI